MTTKKTRILELDIETAPNIGAYFQLYREGNIVWTEKHWYIMSWVAKWEGEDKIIARCLPDYPLYKKDREDDTQLMAELWPLIDDADVIVAHNGDKFDIKKINTRFLLKGFLPPSHYQTVDTKKVAKKYFGFDSNKLDDLAEIFGFGNKIHTDKDLWRDCMSGDLDAWKRMVKYNKMDVILLEKVYLYMRPWMTNHPNMNVISGTVCSCDKCGGRLVKEGTKKRKSGLVQQYRCLECGGWSSGEIIKVDVLIK